MPIRQRFSNAVKLTSALLSATLIMLASTTYVHAQLKENYADLKLKLESKLGLQIESISDAPIKGLLNLNTNVGLFYATQDGEYFMQGRILKVGDEIVDQTEIELKKIRLQGVERFADSVISFKADKEKYAITVFTDTTCGFCQRLHSEVDQLNDLGITVNYLAYPRAGLNSDVYRNTVSIWCADDPQGAITDAKLKQPVAASSCANEVAEHFRFGQKIGVNGTPNIIYPDGTLQPGYLPAAKLAEAIKGAS